MGKLQDKVVIITGGNMGIWRVTVQLFAAEGASVTVAVRREEEGRMVVEQIVADGGKAIFLRTDVSVADDHRKLGDATLMAFGRLDIAFNNAGTE